MRALGTCLILLVCAIPGAGDQWRGAQPLELQSPSGRYKIRVEPGSGDAFEFKNPKREKNAAAILRGPEDQRRTFLLLNPVSPVSGTILDDGTFLGFDNWHSMGYGPVIVCYSPDGAVKWSKEFEELLPQAVLDRVSRSVSSRWWRKEPLEWEQREDEAGTVFGFVTLWNEDKLKIRLSDGVVEYVEVEDLGEDAQRLLRRGEDLLEREEYAKAREVLNHAVRLDPNLIRAYQVLANVYERQEDYAGAIKVLSEGIRENPATEVKPVRRGYQDDPRIWLLLALGRTYEEAKRLQEAEGVFRECLRLDPGFWTAGQELAKLLMDSSRQEEADRLLGNFFEILRGDPEHWMTKWDLTHAALEIGGIYKNRRFSEKAKQYYLRAYGVGDCDQYLAGDLADVLEALGEYKEAGAVLQELKAWLTGRKYAEFYLKRTEEALVRVTEKLKSQQSSDKTDSGAEEPGKPPPSH